MTTTPDLGIPELAQSQANPDITHNEALVLLQALLNGVIDRNLSAPPGSPTEGDSYIIGAAPTGAWAGRANSIAIFWGNAWRFVPANDDSGTPITMSARHEGLSVWVRDENLLYIWTGSPLAWTSYVPPTAAQVSYTPGSPGVIAATNVQDALDELGREKVNVTGDVMTGLLTVGVTSGLAIDARSNDNVALNGRSFRSANAHYGQNLTGARGTAAAPSNINSGDAIQNFRQHYASGAYQTILTENIRTVAAAPSSTDMESQYEIFLCAAASALNTEVFRLRHSTGLSLYGTTVIDSNRVFRSRGYTVATLPANVAGKMAHVTDANTTLTLGIGAVVAGGGANVVPVFNDGANWRIG